MKLKRQKFSLRNCNPPEKRTRRRINELDFKMKFPFYSFDKDMIDLNLLRRFLYQNDIKSYNLYTKDTIKEHMKEMKKLPKKQKKLLPVPVKPDEPVESRWQILDLRRE